MNKQKSLLTQLGETYDRYRAERQAALAAQATPQPKPHSQVRRFLQWLTPNGGTLLLIAILILTQNVWARRTDAPSASSVTTIPYQGRLADINGDPVTGRINMEFRLYDTPTGGSPLWEEFWTGGNAVNVSDGLFSVMLGSINPSLVNVVQGHNELYLGITVGTDSEMEPRVQLGSVPFSVWSLTVADDSITADKIAPGAVGSDEIADGAVTSSKQTITTYQDQNMSYVSLDGTTAVTITEFQFDNVPAGNVFVMVTIPGRHLEGASDFGTLYLEANPGGELAEIATHFLNADYTQLTLYGVLFNFSGGTLTLRVTAHGERDDTQLRFGTEGDPRFSYRITVLAGL